MKEINLHIKQVKVPHEFSRKFPEIKPVHTKYKANELRIFLFYLSVPVLMYYLPKNIWCLLFVYVFATRTLFEPKISQSDLDLAGFYFLIFSFKKILNLQNYVLFC